MRQRLEDFLPDRTRMPGIGLKLDDLLAQAFDQLAKLLVVLGKLVTFGTLSSNGPLKLSQQVNTHLALSLQGKLLGFDVLLLLGKRLLFLVLSAF